MFCIICTTYALSALHINTKEVSHWFPDMRVPKVLIRPPKKRIFGPKTAQLGLKLAFMAKYWPDQRTMRTRCLLGTAKVVFCYVGTKTFASSRKD